MRHLDRRSLVAFAILLYFTDHSLAYARAARRRDLLAAAPARAPAAARRDGGDRRAARLARARRQHALVARPRCSRVVFAVARDPAAAPFARASGRRRARGDHVPVLLRAPLHAAGLRRVAGRRDRRLHARLHHDGRRPEHRRRLRRACSTSATSRSTRPAPTPRPGSPRSSSPARSARRRASASRTARRARAEDDFDFGAVGSCRAPAACTSRSGCCCSSAASSRRSSGS